VRRLDDDLFLCVVPLSVSHPALTHSAELPTSIVAHRETASAAWSWTPLELAQHVSVQAYFASSFARSQSAAPAG
jgi:hypothetical protein